MPTLNLENVYHVTEVALTYKNKIPASHRLKITNSKDAYNILYGSWDHNRIDLLEQFKILLVKGNYCLGISELSTGGTAMCPADPKLVMATALMANAAAIILAHNHPSGNLNASPSDILLTEKMFNAGQILGIDVLDHIILTSDGYSSFGDEGLMPFKAAKLKDPSMW